MNPTVPEGFVPGHQLSRALYEGYVAPALASRLPGLRYAAALIGHGSDVIGFDTARSTDHDWGPRLQVIVEDRVLVETSASILEVVDEALPNSVLGVPVDIPGASNLPGDQLTHHNSPSGRRHGVTVTSVRRLLLDLVGTEDRPQDWDVARWLTTPRQSLLEFTAGPSFRDDGGELTATRAAVAWYPHDLWLYAMSGRWQRIAQIESFVGRAAEVGDDLGSRLLAGQIALDVMHLALLQHRAYAPYPKWLGSAFRRHEDDADVIETLTTAISTGSAAERQRSLVDVLLELSRRHDALRVTPPVRSDVQTFFGRPFPVIWSERIARALHGAMRAPLPSSLPFGIGGIDEISNGTDALASSTFRQSIALLFS